MNSSSQLQGLVSVIIPTYNHAQYVGYAIQSILDQNYWNYQIIVVDDGSTDNTQEVVDQFGDRVDYILQKNKGLSAARNTGIRAATGEFIGLLDADDMYEPDFMSTLVPMLATDPEVGGIYTGFRFIDQLNQPFFRKEICVVPSDKLYKTLIGGNLFVPELMLIRRNCYLDVGMFDESLRACEDWDMWLRITKKYQILGTTKILTRHRVLPESMSSDPIRMLNNRIAVIKKHFNLEVTDVSRWTAIQRRAYARAYLLTAVEYLQNHDVRQAYDCFFEMVTVYPDILAELETFYELGFGDQSKGFRGDFSTLNLPYNSRVLLDMLARLYMAPKITEVVGALRKEAYANAYLVLGLLSYGTRQYSASRGFLLNSILAKPGYVFKRKLVTTFLRSSIKSVLGNIRSSSVIKMKMKF